MPRRLGVLAALVVGLGLMAAPSALAAGSDLSIVVNGSPDPVGAGQYISYEIGVTNLGGTATNVKATAPLPPQTQYVPNSSQCALAGSTITCTAGTMASGDVKVFEVVLRLTNFSFHGNFNHTYTVSSVPADSNLANNSATDVAHVRNDSHDHHVTIEKVEKQFDFNPGEFRTETLTCPNGGSVVDGSVRVDNVDQDTGNLRSLGIVESKSVGNDWEFSAKNYATGRAQAKVFGVCMPKYTESANTDGTGINHKHQITFEPTQFVTMPLPVGRSDIVIHCNAPGSTFVAATAPGYEYLGNAAGEIVRSEADSTSGPGWSFGFEMSAPGSVTVSIRCLHRYVATSEGHTHELWLSHPDKYLVVHPNFPAAGQYDIDCSDEAKGIVGTFDLPHGVWLIGHDPQPKRRSFKLVNETAVDQTVHLDLLCIGDRTGTDPPPPAPPTAVQPTTTPAAGTTALPVGVVCPAGGCSGSVTLLASGSSNRAVAAKARVIGTATFGSHKGGVLKARVTVAKRYRQAIRSGKIRSVTAVVRSYENAVVKRLTLRIKH